MKNEAKTNNLTTKLCKAALSLSMNSISVKNDDCTFIFYEPEQPELLQQIDIKNLKREVRK